MILVAIDYWPAAKWMAARWDEPGSYTSHGWLVPAASLWALWLERERFRGLRPAGTAWGLALTVPALLLHFIAGAADVSSLAAFSFLPLLAGFVLVRLGTAYARAAAFPILFLACMVPPPEFLIDKLNFNLKLAASDAAAWALNLTGMPAIRSGSYLLFGGEKLAIGEACSGLRSLLSLLAVGVFYAWLVRGRGKGAALAVLLALAPAAVAGNGLRIFVVAYLTAWLGQARVFTPLFAGVDLHLITGVIIFAAAFALLHAASLAGERLAPAGRNA